MYMPLLETAARLLIARPMVKRHTVCSVSWSLKMYPPKKILRNGTDPFSYMKSLNRFKTEKRSKDV